MINDEYIELKENYECKVLRYIFIGMILSVFLLSYYFRREVIGDIAAINIIFMGLLSIYLLFNEKKINIKITLVLMIIVTYIIFNDYLINNEGINKIFKNLCIAIMPISLLAIEIEKKYIKGVFISVTKAINLFTVIIFAIGILDYLFNIGIMKFIADKFATTLSGWIGYRYTSYMGHALFTKEIFIYFFLFNSICSKYLDENLINKYIVMIMSLLGVLITGSKAGVLLIVISMIFTVDKKNKYVNIILSLMLILIIYYMGFFNMTISRLSNNTLTSGRTEAGAVIDELNIVPYKMFSGYGENVQMIIEENVGTTIATAAMEYPIKVWTLKYGILCTATIAILIFIYPFLYMIKRKAYYLCFAFLIKVTEINMYNGLVYKPDNMALFMIFTVLIMGISNLDKKALLDKERKNIKQI